MNLHNLFISQSRNDGNKLSKITACKIEHRLAHHPCFCARNLSHCSIDPGFLCFFAVDFLRS